MCGDGLYGERLCPSVCIDNYYCFLIVQQGKVSPAHLHVTWQDLNSVTFFPVLSCWLTNELFGGRCFQVHCFWLLSTVSMVDEGMNFVQVYVLPFKAPAEIVFSLICPLCLLPALEG